MHVCEVRCSALADQCSTLPRTLACERACAPGSQRAASRLVPQADASQADEEHALSRDHGAARGDPHLLAAKGRQAGNAA